MQCSHAHGNFLQRLAGILTLDRRLRLLAGNPAMAKKGANECQIQRAGPCRDLTGLPFNLSKTVRKITNRDAAKVYADLEACLSPKTRSVTQNLDLPF